MTDMVRVGSVEPNYTARGHLSSYSLHLWHDGLHEHREIKSSDPGVLESKAHAVLVKWDEKWAKRQVQLAREANSENAALESAEAQATLAECDQILAASLDVDDKIDWESLKSHAPFFCESAKLPEIRYQETDNAPVGINPVNRTAPPERSSFSPSLSWYHMFLVGARRRLEDEAERQFQDALTSYTAAIQKADAEDLRRTLLLEEQRASFSAAKAEYEGMCAASDAKVDALREGLHSRSPDSVCEHAELVLGNSSYPDWIKTDYAVGYSDDTGILVVDMRLPAPDEVPTLERVSYVKSREERVEKHITEVRRKKLYDSVCYQIALRSMHELFEADEANALDAISFNGWVEAVNPATGIEERSCILTVQAQKAEFMAFDLARVDPKACFKMLRGVAASSLAGLAPVRPILQLETNDKRFVASQNIADHLDASVNLASMPWEDFEHLIRQLFAKVFSSGGAEVHVTQASRDGGVDAIALDPDPIKGGKTVIQAKRYTGTVTVSSVRDLYGTVLNEGANRGILVTTSDYGPDAYRFAQGKPITLLNGSNLLSLLRDHGHAARIDIASARQAMRDVRSKSQQVT